MRKYKKKYFFGKNQKEKIQKIWSRSRIAGGNKNPKTGTKIEKKSLIYKID